MSTPKNNPISLPADYPIHCDATVTRLVMGATIVTLLVATCLLWPVLAACGGSATGETGLWGQFCEAVNTFSHRY